MTSFPRQQARTRRFTLGAARQPTVSPGGDRVVFLRTRGGEDPVTCLWDVEVAADGLGEPRCLADPRDLVPDDSELPAHERARRERARELAGGITAYATDEQVRVVAFSLGGRLYTVALPEGTVVRHPGGDAVFDPRPSPDGRSVAYVSHDALHLLDLVAGPTQPGVTRPVVAEDGVAWGRAEFIAAEEMGRSAGYWWGPDSDRIAVTRVDESAVPRWHLADPSAPWQVPTVLAYPAAGTVNADVRLAVLDVRGSGRRVDIAFGRADLPYLARVVWDAKRLTLQAQSRDQRTSRVLVADTDTGVCTVVRELTDDAWVEPVPGAPAWCGDRLVTVEDRRDHGPHGSRALVLDGEIVTPPGLQVAAVVTATDDTIVFTGCTDDPTQRHVWTFAAASGVQPVGVHDPGVHGAVVRGGTVVRSRASLEDHAPVVEVLFDPGDGQQATVVGRLPNDVATPVVTPDVELLELGERGLRAALLRPAGHDGAPLPVLLDPYGGPHAQRVLQARASYLTSQWLADQGFAVLVVDGRGTPGRGPAWERAVHGDLASAPLEDQLDGLHAAADRFPWLDLTRVAIRGWSFGGTLAALAVLRAPGTVHAAIAGAPVTDWRLYDTHYTERYLGHPDERPEAYAISGLVDGVGRLLGVAEPRQAAPSDVTRPAATSPVTPPAAPPEVTIERDPPRSDGGSLLLIHGLADDNVVAAHSLRLSAALLAAGHAHRFLPLSGVTHLASQEDVAERLLVEQVEFLRATLGSAPR